jgi:hypothetical protein
MPSHTQGPGDSGSKLTLYGSIGTALISAAAVVIVGMINDDDPPVANVSTTSPTTVSTTDPSTKSDHISFNQLRMNGTGGVTVSGITDKDVNATGVFVAIGPKPSGGYWSGFGKVEDQHWQADVATDPPWQDYKISAAYYYGPPGASPALRALPSPEPKVTTEPAVPAVAPAERLVSETTSQSALMFAFQPAPTTSPPPPPDQLVTCVEQFGPSCFDGPEFGPPTDYQPNQ